MKWKNLKENRCPKCSKPFSGLSFSKPAYVRCASCGFVIGEKRFSEIVNSQITADLERKWDEEELPLDKEE